MTYSSTLALNRQRFYKRNQNAVSFRKPGRRMGPISNTVILVVLTCLLGLLYLTQVTKTNAYGYRINELQEQQTELKQEYDELQVTSARLQSFDRVKNSDVANKNLVTAVPSATVQN